MADVKSKESRSYNMSCIKATNTSIETVVRRYLFSRGFRYRKNDKRFPGKPDIVLPKYKTVIFVNGCFWHGHKDCKYFVWPANNAEFWKEKIEKTIKRDKIQIEQLSDLGWRVITVWECELRHGNAEKTLAKLIQDIKNIQ